MQLGSYAPQDGGADSGASVARDGKPPLRATVRSIFQQVADIHTAARRFFLKSSIPDIHKRGRHRSYGTTCSYGTIPVKKKAKPNTYYIQDSHNAR